MVSLSCFNVKTLAGAGELLEVGRQGKSEETILAFNGKACLFDFQSLSYVVELPYLALEALDFLGLEAGFC
jgi:hypothetical protein